MTCTRCMAAIAVLILLTAALAAQSKTSGSLQGVVTTEDGKPFPGATVKLSSDQLIGGTQDTLTNDDGTYRFPSLPPGIYRIEASMEGCTTQAQENFKIALGVASRADFALKAGVQVKDEITVVASTSDVSTVSNAVSHNLALEELEKTPLPRDANSLMNYTPGVNGNLAYGGTQESTNSFNLDGVVVSDPGAGGHWILPNPDWIQEVQVGGLGADAEYGGFTGAMMNIVTKSGGNDFSGDVRFYYSGGGMIADNTTDQGYKELGFSVGGPLAKDRAWFFFSGQESREAHTPDGALEPEKTRLSRYMGKFTFQVDEQNKLVGLVDFDGKWMDYRNVAVDRLPDASEKMRSPNWSYNVSWESLFGSWGFLSAKLTGFRGDWDRLSYHGSNVPGHETIDEIWVDNNEFTRKQQKSRLTGDVSFSVFKDSLITKGDSHQFKFGLIVGKAKHDETRTRNAGYTRRDAYGDNGSSDRGGEIFLFSRQKEYTFYAQDSWKIGRLTFNPGVRVTHYGAGFENGEGDIYSVTFASPRIGLVVDVFGNGKTALKAHYGRIYEGLFAYMYDRERSGNAFTATTYWDYNPITGNYDIPAGSQAAAQADMDPGISHPFVDQFVFTVEHQFLSNYTAGFDVIIRRFKNIQAMVNTNDDYDVLSAPDNPLGGGALPFYDLLSRPDYLLTNPVGAYRSYDSVVGRFEKRFSDNWALKASLVWARLKGNTYAADGYASEWADWNGSTNADGKLPGYNEWEGKVNFTYQFPYGFYTTVYYRYLSGEHWTPYAVFDGLYRNNRSNVYMETRGSQQYPGRHNVDLRINKDFKLNDRMRITAALDFFNLFNSNTILSVNERWGWYNYDYTDHPDGSYWESSSSYQRVLSRELPREIRLQISFHF